MPLNILFVVIDFLIRVAWIPVDECLFPLLSSLVVSVNFRYRRIVNIGIYSHGTFQSTGKRSMTRVRVSQVQLSESASLVEGVIEAYVFPKIVISCESEEATGDKLCFHEVCRLED